MTRNKTEDLIRQLITDLPSNLKSKFADHLADILNIDDDYYTTRLLGDRLYSLNSYIVWELISAPIEKLVDALWRTLELDKKTT